MAKKKKVSNKVKIKSSVPDIKIVRNVNPSINIKFKNIGDVVEVSNKVAKYLLVENKARYGFLEEVK